MKKRTAIVRIEGVLCLDKPGGETDQLGLAFVRALDRVYELWFLTSMLEERHHLVNDWLTDVVALRPGMKIVGPAEADPILYVRKLGYSTDLFVSQDPQECADAMTAGVPACLFASPRYQRAEFRPGTRKGVKPWGALVDEMKVQEKMKADDARTDEDSIDRFEEVI